MLFHHIGSSYKGLAAADFLDCEGGCVFTVRSALNFTAMAPALSCPFSPSRNIMFVYLWREFIPLIHWLALLQRMKEFDFSLPLHLSLLRKSGLSGDSMGKVPATSSWSLVK